MIDWTISLGNLIQIFAITGTAMAIFYGMRSDIRILNNKMTMIEAKQHELNENFKLLSSVLTQVAVQDARLAMSEKAIDELRHGQGFIVKSNG